MTSINSLTEENTKLIRIAINGFGRIGRQFLKIALENTNIEVVAINDLADISNSVYLLKHDSVYGRYSEDVYFDESSLTIKNKKILFFKNPNPQTLPWKDLNIDVVVECTGFFASTEKSNLHIQAGAKRVVISAPTKDKITPMATPNINIESLKNSNITSNASCTTNATTPLAFILSETIGIESVLVNTIHAYTATQYIVDTNCDKDFRRGRAGAINIVPTSSGASEALEAVVPKIAGKTNAMAMRIPVTVGSIIDFTFVASRATSVEEVNGIIKDYAEKEEWKDILEASEEELVSSDIIKNPHGCIVDLALTKVANGNLVKIMAWYDNEWGYVNMLLKHVIEVAKLL